MNSLTRWIVGQSLKESLQDCALTKSMFEGSKSWHDSPQGSKMFSTSGLSWALRDLPRTAFEIRHISWTVSLDIRIGWSLLSHRLAVPKSWAFIAQRLPAQQHRKTLVPFHTFFWSCYVVFEFVQLPWSKESSALATEQHVFFSYVWAACKFGCCYSLYHLTPSEQSGF